MVTETAILTGLNSCTTNHMEMPILWHTFFAAPSICSERRAALVSSLQTQLVKVIHVRLGCVGYAPITVQFTRLDVVSNGPGKRRLLLALFTLRKVLRTVHLFSTAVRRT